MKPKNIAIIGAGIAGITCARTLLQAGHTVQVFEKSRGLGGRMSTRQTPFGSFDHGAQFFTARDPRFSLALSTTPDCVAPWPSARDDGSALVAQPGMNSLLAKWGAPLANIQLQTSVEQISPDVLNRKLWQITTLGPNESHLVYAGFDAVVLAIPSPQAAHLLQASNLGAMAQPINVVTMTPCWTLMLAYPQAADPNLHPVGPGWQTFRMDHPRLAWVARESTKPGRDAIERWTVQANPAWSQEHLDDDADTVVAKLQKAFAQVSGIHSQPVYAQAHRWRYAQTGKALGQPFIWNVKQSIGVCGDWCIGHRVEDGFVSGLELALAMD
jgi:renalase